METIRLTREVRFSIPPHEEALRQPVSNSWAGWPMAEIGWPSIELQCTLSGLPDAVTGYLCDIKVVDQAIRKQVVVTAAERPQVTISWDALFTFCWQQLKSFFPADIEMVRLTMLPNPWLAWTRESGCDAVFMTQQFEFSASHRLHNPDLSDEENRNLFGKCNNPHGHGHNYLVDVTVERTPQTPGAPRPEAMADIVKSTVIDRLDHRNLNIEIEEFRTRIPSVENIVIVIWEWLEPALGKGVLRNLRVYETPKTWVDYSGPA